MRSSTTAVEQVNAWASYEATAKNARKLHHGRREGYQDGARAVGLQRQEQQQLQQPRVTSGRNTFHDYGSSLEIDSTTDNRRGGWQYSEKQRERRLRHSLYSSSHRNLLNTSRHSASGALTGRNQLLSTSKHGFDITETSGDGEHAATSGFFETFEKERRRSSIKQATPTSVTPPDVRGSETEKVNVVVDEEDDEIDIGEMDDETLDAVRGTFPIFFEDPIYPEANKQRTISFKSLLQSVDATMPWQYETLHLSLPKLIWMCLRGIGQVYFMNNPVTGFLILIGLLIQSTRVAVHGVIALVSGTAIALLLGFDTALARSGLFGYNAFLVGLAVATFDSTTKHLGYSVAIIICTIIFASFSSVVFVTLGKLLVPYKSPPLTLPFNLSTIFFLLASANMSRVDLGPVRTPALPDYESPSLEGISAEAFFAGTIRGIGQVFLADNIVTGALVLLGLAVCSRISAVTAYFGSVLGATTALAIGMPGSSIEQGIFGFNASLSVTAMFMFYTPSVGAAVMATLAGIMTVLAQAALATQLEPLGLPFMTLPFCIVGLPFIIIQGTTSIVIPVPLSSMTIPEDHYRIVKMLEDGFCFLKECLEDSDDVTRLRRTVKTRSRKMTKSLSRLKSLLSDVDNDDTDDEKKQRMKEFFFCHKEDPDTATKKSALSLFKKLDSRKVGALQIESLIKVLKEAGLINSEGIHFARLILHAIALNKSTAIDEDEFVAFAVVGSSIDTIRHKLFRFFAFVDEDGNGKVDLDEINHALEYLGQPTLTEKESERLFKMAKWDDEDGIDLIELLNEVTVAKVTSLVGVYHHSRSMHGSMHGSAGNGLSTCEVDNAV